MDCIIKYWDLPNKTTTQIHKFHKSAWNVGDQYILKHRSNTQELSHGIRLAELLISKGLPVAEYIKTVDGQWTTPDGAYCLMKRLNGNHIDLFQAEAEIAMELGRGIARLHVALANIETKLNCKDNDFLSEWANDIKPGLVDVSDEMIVETENRLFELYKKLPRQPIHRDMHTQNVLFNKGKITGWIDFDLVHRDVRMFDLAYLLAGLLYGKIDDPLKIEAWRIIYKNLLAGYDEVNPITSDERAALPVMMIAIELLFVTFWNKRGNIDKCNEANVLAQWLYHEMLNNS